MYIFKKKQPKQCELAGGGGDGPQTNTITQQKHANYFQYNKYPLPMKF